jgi:hypothetical protein
MFITKKLLERITIVSAIILSYSFIPDYGADTPKFIVFITLCVSLGLLFKSKVITQKFDVSIRASGLLMVFLIIIMLYHERWSDLNFILKLGIAYIMALTIKLDTALEWMCTLSQKLLIPTVIGFVLGSMGYVFNVTGILTDGRELFLTPMLTSQKDIIFTRATSYFWEPGVFAFVVNIVVAYKLFRKESGLKSIKIEVLYLLIAQSAGGIFAFFFLLFAFFIRVTKNSKVEHIICITFILFAISFFSNLQGNIGFLTDVLNFFTLILFNRNLLLDLSYGARIVDFYAPFYAAFESPIWGLKNLDAYLAFSEQIRGFSIEQITNTWSSLAYKFGYPFMFLYLYFVFISTKKYFNSPLVPFVFLILLSSSPVYVNIMTLYLIVSMFEQKRKQ